MKEPSPERAVGVRYRPQFVPKSWQAKMHSGAHAAVQHSAMPQPLGPHT
jgi:hypothetical protein